MLLLVALIAFPTIVGFLVSYMMNTDRKHDRVRRMFSTRRKIKILCLAHAKKLKRGQIALLDPSRCKNCFDKSLKK